MKLRTQDAVVGAAVVLVQVLGVLSLPTDWRDLRTWQSAGFVAAAAVLFTGPLIAAWAAWHEARRRRASDLVTVAVRARAAVLFAWHAPIGLTIVALSLLSTLSIVFLSRGPMSGTSLLGSLALAPVIAAGCG
ncbi:MAG: hypothetical protein Q4G46_00025, partial [Propionibacteriaceae bacterium]|nr:hypothetical protein [Propionibacteriaceae bacterium]